MKRIRLIKELENLLKRHQKELRPHNLKPIRETLFECWVLDNAIRNLKELEK